MAIRVSISIDPDTMDLIDKFALEHGIDRNRAILECIEAGYTQITGGSAITVNQQRAYEEYHALTLSMSEVRTALTNLVQEVRLMHHTVEQDWKEMRTVPYQSRRWWEFWKSQ
ncbi:MAG: type II secretion system protein E [Methanolinea sp.]|nr:type II secretion system protein E [Methanolinea sp.]